MLNKLFLILVGSLIASVSFAGQETHGGDALVCEGRLPVVLDYYMANLPTVAGSVQTEDLKGKSAQEVVDIFRAKLQNSFLGELVESHLDFYLNLNNWILASGLNDIKDEGLLFTLPGNCSLVQAALRVPGAIYLDSLIAHEMPAEQFGVLMMHELFYEIAVENGKEDSGGVKILIRALLNIKSTEADLELAAGSIGSSFSMYKALEKVQCNQAHLCVRADYSTHQVYIFDNRYEKNSSSNLQCDEAGKHCRVINGSGTLLRSNGEFSFEVGSAPKQIDLVQQLTSGQKQVLHAFLMD